MNAFQTLRVGEGVYRSWLGEGLKPVGSPTANWRANICVTCPKNKSGPWWAWVTTAVALSIREYQRPRFQMILMTPHDDTLHTCTVCNCPLREKVHVPFAHIERNMPAEAWNKFPDFCWIRKEAGK